MSSLDKLGVVIQYEFLKHIRRARLYIVLGIALLAEALVLILLPVLNHHFPDNIMAMAATLTVGPSLAALGAVFFAGDAIAGEYESKTGFLLFINPIKREVLWIGKYIASFIAITLMIIFSYVIIAVSLLLIYHQVPWQMYESFGLALFYAAGVLSTTFLFSAISRGSMGATIMTLLFVWIVCGILETVLSLTGKPYWFVLSAGGDSIATVYGGMDVMLSGLGGGGGMSGLADTFKLTSVAMASWGVAIYFVGGLFGSIFLARRRQLS